MEITDEAARLQRWTDGRPGPFFYEETTYRVWAKSVGYDQPPRLIHRDPYLLRDVDEYPRDRMCAGPLNFGRQVGLSRLQIVVGHDILSMVIEVFPAKIDYESDYAEMLADVADQSRALAFEFLRATYLRAGLEDAEEPTKLEWLTIVRAEIVRLDRAMTYINAHPYRALQREPQQLSADRVKRVDSLVRRAIIRRQGRGEWLTLRPGLIIRQRLPAYRSQETVDTPEHRWLKLRLRLIRDRLAELRELVVSEMEAAKGRGRGVSQRLREEEKELSGLVATVGRLLDLAIFDGVVEVPVPGFSSLALLSAPGYADAYRGIALLQMGLSIDGDALDSSIKELHTLYESWCYIKLVTAVGTLPAVVAHLEEMIGVESSGIRVRLKRGKASQIAWQGGGRRIVLTYNPEFPGLTGLQRPDIVMRFEHPGWPDLIVIFDAKYRLDNSQEYRTAFGTAGPPDDAIGALHRYRDAILLDAQKPERGRPVVKGVALFPLGATDSAAFKSSRLYKALLTLGIGALPFLPSNTQIVDEWLKDLFSLPPDELAVPGPPFAGWEERRRREAQALQG